MKETWLGIEVYKWYSVWKRNGNNKTLHKLSFTWILLGHPSLIVNYGITLFKIFICDGKSLDIWSEITFLCASSKTWFPTVYPMIYLPKWKFWIWLSPFLQFHSNWSVASSIKLQVIKWNLTHLMTSKYFRQYNAGYTVTIFWRNPIRHLVTKSSALECFIYRPW